MATTPCTHREHISAKQLCFYWSDIIGKLPAISVPTYDEVWINNDQLGREEVIKAIMLNKPVSRFREKFQYSNVMYTAAGECVAKAQDSTWEDVIATRIFKPLGIDNSAPSLKDLRDSTNLSIGYEIGKKPKQERSVCRLLCPGPQR